MGDAPDADDTDETVDDTVEVDLSDPDREEARRRIRDGDLEVDDIKDDELRAFVQDAAADDDGDEEVLHGESDDIKYEDDDSRRVKLGEDDDVPDDERYESGDINVEEDVDVKGDTSVSEKGGVNVMDGVEDEDVSAAMDEVALNVRDDIDPEHFDYDEQDFSSFGSYDEVVAIEYNDAVFRLEMPGDRVQQRLINEMQQQGTSQTEMMEAVIRHTVTGPSDIESVVEEWTPFERLGLGVQCIQFLGLDSLGNM